MKLLFQILLFFTLAQLIGLFTADIIIKDINVNPYVQGFIVTEDSEDVFNAVYFFVYVLIGAIVIMAIIKFYKGEMLFRLLEVLMISTASSIVFYAVLRALGNDYESATLFAVALGLAFAIAKFFLPKLKNAAAILATGGVGVIFGISLGILPIIIMLLLLSIYDFIAVFKTKHMVKMAEVLIKNDLAFTVSASVKEGKPRFTEKGERNRIDLGTGDIVAPVMFDVSALSLSPIASLFIFIGSIVSIVLLMYFAMRKKVILPALPPITLGMLVFFILGRLLGFY